MMTFSADLQGFDEVTVCAFRTRAASAAVSREFGLSLGAQPIEGVAAQPIGDGGVEPGTELAPLVSRGGAHED